MQRALLLQALLLLAGVFLNGDARPQELIEVTSEELMLPMAVKPEEVTPRTLLQAGLSYPSYPSYPPPPIGGIIDEPPPDDGSGGGGQPPSPEPGQGDEGEDDDDDGQPDQPTRNPAAPGPTDRDTRVRVQANDEPTAIQVANEAASFLEGRGAARRLLDAEDIIRELEQEAEASSSVDGVNARVFAVSREGTTLNFDLRLSYPPDTSEDDIEADAQQTRSNLSNKISSSNSRLNSLMASAGLDPNSASVEEGPAVQKWVAPDGTENTRDTNVTLTPQNVDNVDDALDSYFQQQASSRRRLLGVSEFVTELNDNDWTDATASLVAYRVLDNDDITIVIRLTYPSDFESDEMDADALGFQKAVNNDLGKRDSSLKSAFGFNAQWQQLQLMFQPAEGVVASSGACSSRAGFLLAALALLAAFLM